MEINELLLSIGRLYVEAARLQAAAQQLQQQGDAKDVAISELQKQLTDINTSTKQPQQVNVTNLPKELIATVTPDGLVSADGLK